MESRANHLRTYTVGFNTINRLVDFYSMDQMIAYSAINYRQIWFPNYRMSSVVSCTVEVSKNKIVVKYVRVDDWSGE